MQARAAMATFTRKRRGEGTIAVLIRRAHPWGGDSGDVLVRDGTIAARGDDLTAPDGADVINGSGCMLLPGLVDAQTHLDKTLLGTPWRPRDPTETLAEQIDIHLHDLGDMRTLTIEMMAERTVSLGL
tara:strand:- start:127 stop:510 length:384 start_codon:yes stop_codon:yes gene_type:complete